MFYRAILNGQQGLVDFSTRVLHGEYRLTVTQSACFLIHVLGFYLRFIELIEEAGSGVKALQKAKHTQEIETLCKHQKYNPLTLTWRKSDTEAHVKSVDTWKPYSHDINYRDIKTNSGTFRSSQSTLCSSD